MSAPIRVMVFPLASAPYVAMLAPDAKGSHLTAMQAIVGGTVELIQLDDGIDVWCNDDAIALGLPVSWVTSAIAPTVPEGFEGFERIEDGLAKPGEPGEWHIRGDFFLARSTKDGDIAGLTDEDIIKWKMLWVASQGRV